MKFFRVFPLCRVLPLVAATSIVAGCGMFRSSGDDYYQAGSLPPLKLPEGTRSAALEPLYPVPELSQQEDELLLSRDYGRYEAPRPDPLATSGATESGVKIQRLGNERWILIDAPTSQVWPRVQSFLSRYGIGVETNNPATGLIETGWVRFKVDDELKHRFRIWIERGLRPDTAEVYVVHRQVPESFSDPSALEWTRESEDFERESFLMDELANALAADARNSSASLLGQSVGGEAKSDILFVDGEPVLRLRLSYDRAWATVGHALGQEEFALWESDNARGVALVGHVFNDGESETFLGRLFTGGELPNQAPTTISDALASLAPAREAKALFGDIPETEFGSPEAHENTYLVVVKAGEAGTSVYLRSADGTRISPREARRILTKIRRNLI